MLTVQVQDVYQPEGLEGSSWYSDQSSAGVCHCATGTGTALAPYPVPKGGVKWLVVVSAPAIVRIKLMGGDGTFTYP